MLAMVCGEPYLGLDKKGSLRSLPSRCTDCQFPEAHFWFCYARVALGPSCPAIRELSNIIIRESRETLQLAKGPPLERLGFSQVPRAVPNHRTPRSGKWRQTDLASSHHDHHNRSTLHL